MLLPAHVDLRVSRAASEIDINVIVQILKIISQPILFSRMQTVNRQALAATGGSATWVQLSFAPIEASEQQSYRIGPASAAH
jgi:hypothetical protein